MEKQLTPYLIYGIGIFLNFYWIFQREQLSMNVQVMFLSLTIFLIVLATVLGAISQTGKKKKLFLQGGQWILFVYYLYILTMLLFFGGLFQIDRSYQGEFQMVPFQTIRSYIIHYGNTGNMISFYNLLGNLLVMMPLGYFIPSLLPKFQNIKLFLPFILVICLAVEWIQWKTATGIGDIDDSILNFLGAMFSYAVTRGHQMLQKALKV
ncbi:MAG: VanZ family protein [Eubacteriales bacterium]